MGIKKTLGMFRKKQEKELQNRANQFMQEYRTIRARYRCDFQSYIEMIDGGVAGFRPKLRIIDVSEQVEKEEKDEKKAEEEKERQRLEGKSKIEKNGK